MAEALSIISLISFVVSGVCLLLAVLFWFIFDIPTVYGDLSGRTARKSIAQMRENNEKSGKVLYRSSITNLERGKTTDTTPEFTKSGIKRKELGIPENERMETGLLSDNKADNQEEQQTELLNGEETGLLSDEFMTAQLDALLQQPAPQREGKKLVMLNEVMLIHTEEVIE